jgi:hypothetical protein
MDLKSLIVKERHEQRVFAVVILVEAALLVICVTALGIAMFVKAAENSEAMTALVSITTTLIGSFTTLLAARGILNHKEKHPDE